MWEIRSLKTDMMMTLSALTANDNPNPPTNYPPLPSHQHAVLTGS